MSNISELKNRLNAIKQTRQITGAMYLLSTSRMKKSMQNIDFNLT
jgi:F0F1-type ATP synthase gamma subunit